MRARPLLIGLALGSAAVATTAHAAPVTQSRIAVADLRLGLARGHYVDVSLHLTSPDGVERLRVETQRCGTNGCAPVEAFVGAVGGSVVSAASADARLHAVLDGLALTVTWVADDAGTVVIGGTRIDGNDDGDTLATYNGSPATVHLALGDTSCATGGAVGDEVRVSDSASEGALPLSELELPNGTLTC